MRYSLPLVCVLGLSVFTPAQGDEFLAHSRFYKQLSQPINVVFDGKPFRETIVDVAATSGVNVWMDRRVDPTATVSAGQLGPTVIDGLRRVAKQRGCVVMPAANVVLIGPEPWVDGLATALISIPKSYASTNFTWDDLTTPSEAFSMIVDSKTAFRFPHDLWASTDLRHVKRPVAANLVLAQFGRTLKSHKNIDPAESEILRSDVPATRVYSFSERLQSDLKKLDPECECFPQREKLVVKAVAKTHRAILVQYLGQAQPKPANVGPNGNAPQPVKRTFTLNLVATPAMDAINQFAAKLGINCTADEAATESASKLVTLEAKDKTLNELIEMVAKSAGLDVSWQQNGDARLSVSSSKK